MSEQDMNQIVLRTITDILENAAFVFVDDLSAAERPQLQSWKPAGVSLCFKGRPSGCLRLWAGPDFAVVLAANMLGCEEDGVAAAGKSLDALKEILNMITGTFLTAGYGADALFDLGLPEVVAADKLENDYGNPGAVWLLAEGHPLMFLVEVDDQ